MQLQINAIKHVRVSIEESSQLLRCLDVDGNMLRKQGQQLAMRTEEKLLFRALANFYTLPRLSQVISSAKNNVVIVDGLSVRSVQLSDEPISYMVLN